MDGTLIGLVAFAAVIGLLAIRVPIAFALAGVATVGTFVIFAFRTGVFMPDRAIRPTSSLVFSNSFDLIHSYDLSMIPLFVALGHIAYRAEITTKIYHAARVWLAMANSSICSRVISCSSATFSAVTPIWPVPKGQLSAPSIMSSDFTSPIFCPQRMAGMIYGERLMLSLPPASAMAASP